MTCCDEKVLQNKRSYRPNYKDKALTEKFYARHDRLEDGEKYRKSATLYAGIIGEKQHFDIREHQLAPRTENQIYGWLSNQAFRYEGYDVDILCHPRKTDPEIKVLMGVWMDLKRSRQINNIK